MADRGLGNRLNWHRSAGEQLGIGIHYRPDHSFAGVWADARRISAGRPDKTCQSNWRDGWDGGDFGNHDLHKILHSDPALGGREICFPSYRMDGMGGPAYRHRVDLVRADWNDHLLWGRVFAERSIQGRGSK